MSLLKFAQNVEYLIKLGVPVEAAADVLRWLKSIPEDVKWMLPKIKENKGLDLAGYQAVYKDIKERGAIDPVIVAWANKVSMGHSKWLINLATKKLVRIGEDDAKLRILLRNFEAVKKKGLLPLEQRDIMKFKNDTELFNVVKPFLLLGHSDEILIPEDTEGLLYSGNGIQILRVTDKDVAARFATDTNWCVKAASTASGYLDQGPLHFVFVDNRKTVLIHTPTGQIKELNDTPLKNYSVIRRIQPILQELGLDGKVEGGKDYGDYSAYNKTLEEGARVNSLMAMQVERGIPPATAITEISKTADDHKNVLLYLEDVYIQDPAIQEMCNKTFLPEIQRDVDEIYQEMPRQIQLLPKIFEACKTAFVKKIVNNPGSYDVCSNDLKKLPEIQQARFQGYVNMVFKDPTMIDENIPEEYQGRPEFVKAREEGWYNLLDKDPSKYTNCPPEIKNTKKAENMVWDACLREVEKDPRKFFEIVPVEFQNDSYIRDMAINGWIMLIHRNPLYYAACPDEFKELDVVKNAFSAKDKFTMLDDKEAVQLSAEEIRGAIVRNWVQRIQTRLTDYQFVPPDLKQDPTIFNTALQGWVDLIGRNPHQINYCPKEFKKHPLVREELYKRNPVMRQKMQGKADSFNWYRLAILDDPEVAGIE